MDAREHKLALARKKLKEFQANQSTVGSSAHGGSQTLNSSQSSLVTTSLGGAKEQHKQYISNEQQIADFSGRMSAVSLPNSAPLGGFTHDEATSPFERVERRARSHSRDATLPGAVDFTEEPQQPLKDEVLLATPEKQPLEISRSEPLPFHDSGTGKFMNGHSGVALPTASVEEELPIVPEQVSAPDFQPPTTKTGLEESVESQLLSQRQLSDQLTSQLQEIYGHYTQLHTAYTGLVSSVQQQAACSSDSQQQQNTIAVMVEEKADLQSQLRQAMDIANKKHMENEELHGRLKACRERLDELESKSDNSSRSQLDLQQTLNKQMVELDKRRQEASQWEAKVVGLQQDKSELQARLKVKAREVDRLQAEIGDHRKQIQMKEIYIRQLSAHAAGVSRANEQEDHILKLENEVSTMKTELAEAKSSADAWRTEAQTAKQHYEQYGATMNQKLLQLNAQLESVTEERTRLESRCAELNERLSELSSSSSVSPDAQADAATPDQSAPDARQQQLEAAQSQLQATTAQLNELNSVINTKDNELDALKQQVAHKGRRLEQLEEQLGIRTQYSADTQKLVEQVQNERATVSRAVAQNRELKDQLVELQDQFVKLTNEKADLITKLQSLEYENVQQSQNKEQNSIEKEDLLEQLQNELVSVRAELEAEQARAHEMHTQLTLQLVQAQRAQPAAADNDTQQLRSERQALDQENKEMRARIEHLNAVLSTNSSPLRNGKEIPEGSTVEQLSERVQELQQELQHTTTASNRIASENAELHRIMQQNAEDENQNSIYVELQQALDRITSLSDECKQLRTALADQAVDQVVSVANAHLLDDVPDLDDDADNEQLSLEEQRQVLDENLNLKAELQMIKDQRGIVSVRDLLNGNTASLQQKPAHATSNGTSQTDQQPPDTPAATVESGRESICSEHQDQRGDGVSKRAFEQMRTAMNQLQERFNLAMHKNADLDDKNQQLEHLITQLQHETDTVGEYITIYQHNRRQMRQRLQDKEHLLQRLSREKQAIQDNLLALQKLVMELLQARGDLHLYNTNGGKTQQRRRTFSQTQVDELSGDEEIVIGEEAAQLNDADEQLSHVSGTTAEILRLLSEMRQPELTDLLPVVDRSIHCRECTGKLHVV